MPRPLGDSCPCEGTSCGLKLTVQFQWTSQTIKSTDRSRQGGKRGGMSDQTYEEPEIRVLGEVTDLTQMSKPGVFFDFPGSGEGNTTRFPHHMS